MPNRLIEVLGVSFFVIIASFYYFKFVPISKDIQPCLIKARAEANALSDDEKAREMTAGQQCRQVKPVLTSFNLCIETVRTKHGYLATDIVYKMVSMPLGAYAKFKEIEATCSRY